MTSPTGYRWAKWPFIRGNVALVDTLVLGLSSLMFSFNVLVEEQLELERKAAEEAAADPPSVLDEDTGGKRKRKKPKPPKKQSGHGLGGVGWRCCRRWPLVWACSCSCPPAALVKGLFSEPSDLVKNAGRGRGAAGHHHELHPVISLLPDIRRLFQYHGGEHATINCYEDGQPVTLESVKAYGPLHPRCGTAFMLVFIVVKIIVGTVCPTRTSCGSSCCCA
jgi:hypothetical protein